MKRRFVAVLACAAAGAVLLSACGGGGGTSGTGGDGQKTRIRFASWDVAENIDAQQAMVDRFNAEHDDIEVVLEAYGDDFDTKISAGMGSGDTPDVMYMWNYPAYAQGLEPLDSYIEGEGEGYRENFYETLWDYNSLDGSVYGIPIGFTTHALFYNKDIFAQAGLEEPTNDWTWEDLIAAARTITEKVEDTKGFSFQMKPDPYDFEMYLWSNGTAYVDAQGSLEGNLNSEAAKQVVEMFQEMEKEGCAVATEGSGTSEFRAGSTAMYIYGSWSIDSLNEDGVNYGVVDIPAFSAQQDSVSILSSSGISISKDSANKEAAWEFVRFWTGEEMNRERIGTELPVLQSVVEAEGVMEKPEYTAFYSMLEQSGGHTPASFLVDGWSELSETLSLSFERVFNTSTLEDVSSVLDEAAIR